jgi:hypothetical protein
LISYSKIPSGWSKEETAFTVGEIVIVSVLSSIIIILHLVYPISNGTDFEFMDVLILGLIGFAVHVFYTLTKLSQKQKDIEQKVLKTGQKLSNINNKHSLELSIIGDCLRKDIQKVGYIEGEDNIIERLEITKELTRGTFFGMWCIDYSASLEDYFRKDTAFQGKKRV